MAGAHQMPKGTSMNKILPSLLFASLIVTGVRALAAQERTAGTPQKPASTSQPEGRMENVEQDVLYASAKGTELHLDVYQPANRSAAPRPAVILIHGGGWTDFDKSTMHGMGMFLARSGFVAFSVDYRLFRGTENPWPAQLDDVQLAVRWVRANAEKYYVSPDRIGAFGHSAGAQLAALLGMEDTRDNADPALAKYSSRVQAVVAVSGPTDFTTESNPDGIAFLDSFLGGSYAQRPGIWKEASPVFHVSKENAPFLIVHGTQDDSVAISQAQELYEKLRAAGVSVSFIKVDDGHTFRTPEARRRLAIETAAFFERNLGTKE